MSTYAETETEFAATWPATLGPAEAGLFYDRTTNTLAVGMRRVGGEWTKRPVPYASPAIESMDDFHAAVEAHPQRMRTR